MPDYICFHIHQGFSPSVDWDTVDFKKSPAIQELPVQSAISEPTEGSTAAIIDGDKIKVSGYAWSGGGRKIIRVDVSADGGSTWKTSNLEHADAKKDVVDVDNREWAWALWKVTPISSRHFQLFFFMAFIRRDFYFICSLPDLMAMSTHRCGEFPPVSSIG